MTRLVVFAAVCGLLQAQVKEQVDETPTFRTSVAVVKVDTKVTGRDGRSINDLTKDDLLVFDEDNPRPILDFGRESVTEPLRLLLLLDVDRKSTRLNSSHLVISYAVFCLKKKNIII